MLQAARCLDTWVRELIKQLVSGQMVDFQEHGHCPHHNHANMQTLKCISQNNYTILILVYFHTTVFFAIHFLENEILQDFMSSCTSGGLHPHLTSPPIWLLSNPPSKFPLKVLFHSCARHIAEASAHLTSVPARLENKNKITMGGAPVWTNHRYSSAPLSPTWCSLTIFFHNLMHCPHKIMYEQNDWSLSQNTLTYDYIRNICTPTYSCDYLNQPIVW